MGINSTDTAYNFGQLGSVFNNTTNAMSPPSGKVFVAVTMVTAATFDNTVGLVADNDASNGVEYIGSVAAHDIAHDGTATTTSGTGGIAIPVGTTFPAGLTIYGRWTSINPASGTIIAYIGN